MRVERDTNVESGAFDAIDLGISVVFTKEANRILVEYAAQGRQGPRCMVASCSASMNSNQCCARIVCNDCLGFGVTTFSGEIILPRISLRICVECVTQVVDAMDSAGKRIR